MGNVTRSAHPVSQVRYLLEWMDEEDEDEGEVRLEAPLCHPLCQCPNCAPTQKVRRWPGQQRGRRLNAVTPFPLNSLIFLQLSVQQAGTLGVNSCNVDAFTPLHVAALHGHLALATLLIRHGANVNARTNQSATPLHLACQNSHIPVCDKGKVKV